MKLQHGKLQHMTNSLLKTRKRENMEINEYFYINLHLKDSLGMELTAC